MAGAEVQRRNGHDRRLGFSDVLRAIGPGVITGGADNDPAGIATYSVVGATVGYAQNWLLLLSTPMLIVVQQISAKVANVTKTDLATLLRNTYGARVATPAVLLMVVANVITMGADLLAMAAAMELLTGARFVFWVVPLAALMAYVTIFTDYRVLSKYLLWLVAIFATYILAAFLARPNWADVVRSTFVPHVSFGAGIPARIGRSPWHDDHSIPLLLAGQRRGGGATRRAGHEPAEHRHHRRHDLVEPHCLFHHGVDRDGSL